MTNINCNICTDLISLVHNDAACEDSRAAVLSHIQHCPACRTLYENNITLPVDTAQHLCKRQQTVHIFSSMLMMLGIVYGLMQTGGNGIFQNVIIMPIIGGIGYYLFRWKALCILPLLLLITHIIINTISLSGDHLEFTGLLMWTALYCLTASVGFLITALLHFATKKEDDG